MNFNSHEISKYIEAMLTAIPKWVRQWQATTLSVCLVGKEQIIA